MSFQMLATDNLRMKEELYALSSDENDEIIIRRAALILNSTIKKMDLSQCWPPNLEELNSSLNTIPACVTHFIQTLLTSEVNIEQVSDRVDRVPGSFENGEMTTLVKDNIDRLEDTLSGAGTSLSS